MTPQNILQFWFEEIDSKCWFSKNEEFDQSLHARFGKLYHQTIQCELYQWRATAEGRLAEIIILDQFSRNMFRDKPASFAQDSLALALAQEAVAKGEDQKLPPERRCFMYMPYMHSESALIHKEAVRLFSQKGLEFNMDYELQHKSIIDRFGRYPHRNKILGRESTREEVDFLKTEGSGF
ncbi:hypothetical protein D3C87_1318320 [compost metagenome]